MRYILRIINVLIAAAGSSVVFNKLYNEYYSYLPPYEKLNDLNIAPGMSIVLRENSIGLRELYNHALEKSIIFAGISFILIIIILEYIRAGNYIVYYFTGMKNQKNIMNLDK